MRKAPIYILLLAFITHMSFSQKIRIYNTTFKVKDIMGTPNLSPQKWNKELPELLLSDEATYLKYIGTYRNNWNSTEPHSLFNLSDKGSYPLLDQVNIAFYDEVVIPNLKLDANIKGRTDFKEFCAAWNPLNNYADRKALLFKDEFIDIGRLIQQMRFVFKVTPFNIQHDKLKKVDAKITADIKADLKANNIDASAALLNHLTKVVTEQTKYSGQFIVAEFDSDYMNRLSMALNGISGRNAGNDNFARALKDYAAPNSQRAATTGLIAFKIKGEINKSNLSENLLKADLNAKFSSLGQKKIDDIAATVSLTFTRKVEDTFNADFENLYIKNYLTSELIDSIEVAKLFLNLSNVETLKG